MRLKKVEGWDNVTRLVEFLGENCKHKIISKALKNNATKCNFILDQESFILVVKESTKIKRTKLPNAIFQSPFFTCGNVCLDCFEGREDHICTFYVDDRVLEINDFVYDLLTSLL